MIWAIDEKVAGMWQAMGQIWALNRPLNIPSSMYDRNTRMVTEKSRNHTLSYLHFISLITEEHNIMIFCTEKVIRVYQILLYVNCSTHFSAIRYMHAASTLTDYSELYSRLAGFVFE